MSLHRLSSASGLLASKGAATPLGLKKASVEEASIDPEESKVAAEPITPRQLTLVADLEDQAGAAGEPPPPASLLPFALHRKRPEQSDAWELVSPDLLAKLAKETGKESGETAKDKQEPVPDVVLTETQKTEESEEVPPPSLGPPGADVEDDSLEAAEPLPSLEVSQAPEARDASTEYRAVASAVTAPVPSAPAATPTWREGAGPRPAAWDSGSISWMGWAAAIVLVGGIAWWSFSNQVPALGESRPEAVTPAAVQTETSPAPSAPRESTIEVPVKSVEVPVKSLAPTVAPVVPEPSAPVVESGEATAIAPTPSEAALRTPAAPVVVAPSVDLVRVEENGDAVIAGRAEPHAELIVLDNGTPIGSVKADAFGEWVFVPDQPLPQGAHEFGLVLKAVQGTISIPAEAEKTPEVEVLPVQGEEPKDPADSSSLLAPLPSRKPGATSSENAVVAPIPERKPEVVVEPSPTPSSIPSSKSSALSPPGPDFVVQLASVKTRVGARQEWRKLQSRYPKALSGMDLKLHETKLSQKGIVIRVRTGPFPGFNEAVDFCAQIRTARQDCLVVRTSSRN